MTVATLEDVAVELGRPTPDASSAEGLQWQMWLNDAEMQIELRLGDVAELDQRVVKFVERVAVAAKVKQPDAMTSSSTNVSVDDASVQKTASYQRSTGLVTIDDDWWDMLMGDDASGAWSVQPSFEPTNCWPSYVINGGSS